MSENPVDEVISELNKVSLNEADLKDDVNYQNIIEKICCNDQKRIDCYTHFLTTELMSAICENLNNSNSEKVCNTANFVALLGKYEKCREYLANINLIRLLIANLKSDNLSVLIQSCRALANICFEKVQAQNSILEEGGLGPVLDLMKNTSSPNRVENNQKFKEVIVGLLLNLVANNEPIQKQVLESNILPTFVELIKADLQNGETTLISQNVFFILVALSESTAVDAVFTEEVCRLAVEMFRKSFGSEFCVTGLETLEDAELPDPVKFNLAKAGIFQLFIDILDNKPKVLTADETTKYDLTGRVLANILTGDDAMEYLYELNDCEIMNDLTRWLSSEDKEIVHTAVLCIGNVARTDVHSMSIVAKGIHKSLLKILSDTSNDIKIQYAAISTIRNLSIPRANKIRLVEDGLIDILFPLMDLDVKTSSPVIFKLVGTLRQVIDGQTSLATELGCNKKIVSRLVTWSSSTINPWVSSDCSRFLCWLVKISKSKDVILNILENGGYSQIMKMLGALHGLMQSESVTALTMTSAIIQLWMASSDGTQPQEECDKEMARLLNFESILVEGDVGEKLKHLLLQHGANMDENVLENVFTFLETVTKFGKVEKHFRDRDLKSVFHSTMRSRDDYNRFKYRIERIEMIL
ncbi:UNVERIFIED_CONTAM: hypothetical protein PYX00_009288 [Menopon gallinae]|uniref:Armadillo repeat-containing protein n=1 Tax=Menopon gallinae TaxID=328185 RepID=A0AAW2HAP1_9NEOP